MYVTEYESAYTWPEVWEQRKAEAALMAAQEAARARAEAERAAKAPWSALERAVEDLATHSAADEAVHGHKLDETIEKVYRTYKAKLASMSSAAAAEEKKQEKEMKEGKEGRGIPSEEAMRLFCDGVEAVKRSSSGAASAGAGKGKPTNAKAHVAQK